MNIKALESDFQMIGNTLRELSIKNPKLVSLGEACEEKALDLSHQILDIQEQSNGYLLGIVILHIKISLGKGKEKVRINMSIEGAFITRGTDKEQFKKMLSINGVAATYSVARSIIIGITAQTFTRGSVILPMINVFQYSKDLSANEPKE